MKILQEPVKSSTEPLTKLISCGMPCVIEGSSLLYPSIYRIEGKEKRRDEEEGDHRFFFFDTFRTINSLIILGRMCASR